MSHGHGSKATYKVEDVYTQSMSTGDCQEEQQCSDGGWDASAVGVWICAIILIIIFSLILWWGFSCWSNGRKGRGKGKHGRDGGGVGAIGAFLVWLIIVIIFIVAVAWCGWGAIIVFLILFIIIAILAWGWSSWGGDGCRDDC